MLANLSYATLFDVWDENRKEMMEKTRSYIPKSMQKLSRTVKNFAPLTYLVLEVLHDSSCILKKISCFLMII